MTLLLKAEPTHRNNIGLLRIVLASLVVISHSVEITDGSREREPLTALFRTVSLGDVALAGFFLLSGYLITRSYVSARSTSEYLLHRIARIYPAYLIAFAVAVLIEAPLLGYSPWGSLPRLLLDASMLRQPIVQGVHLNIPSWTVSFEFQCYLLTVIVGSLGLFQHRRAILALTLAVTAAAFVSFLFKDTQTVQYVQNLPGWDRSLGEIRRTFQFGSTYLVGTCVYLFWDVVRPRLTPRVALSAFALCVAFLSIDVPTAYPSLAVFGAVPLFWLALRTDLGRVQQINDRWDISYGTYLYGWIIQLLLMKALPTIGPFALTAVAVPLAWGAGLLSWILIESRVKDYLRARSRSERMAQG